MRSNEHRLFSFSPSTSPTHTLLDVSKATHIEELSVEGALTHDVLMEIMSRKLRIETYNNGTSGHKFPDITAAHIKYRLYYRSLRRHNDNLIIVIVKSRSYAGRSGINYVHPFLRRNNWCSRSLMLCGNFNMTNVDDIFRSVVEKGP